MSAKTIVICDDNDPLVQVMSHMLAKNGYSVRTAPDGHSGLALVRSSVPDLLLLDLEMPAMDGFALLEGLGALPDRRPYTIVITAQENPAKHEKAKSLGAEEVWRKPFRVSDLVARIEAAIP